MNELKIEVIDTLTRSSCSQLVIKIIQHILYNSQQIPVNYDFLARYIKRGKWLLDSKGGENETVVGSSYKKMLVERFISQVLSAYNGFEDTFKNLEQEFMENNNLKEIIIMIGGTMIMPKKVFRIDIPVLQDCKCNKRNSLQNNLLCVFKGLINSEHLHCYLKDNLCPMNIYLLIKTNSSELPKSGAFLPKDNFKVPNVKHIHIKLKQPENSDCKCPSVRDLNEISTEICTTESEDCESVSESCWYQPKLNLKGFKDQNVDGKSAFSFLVC